MITIIIEYESYNMMIQSFDRLRNQKIEFWYMHKENKIRLRIYENDVLNVRKILDEKKIFYTVVFYEPESNLFGGTMTIEIVHKLLCELCLFVLCMKDRIPIEVHEIMCVKLLMELVDSSGLDSFEKWDVWCKVSAKRKIINKVGIQVVLNHLGEVYELSENDIIFYELVGNQGEHKYLFDNIQDKVEKIIEYQKKGISTRGARGILSSVIIFSFNMMNISAKKQAIYAKTIEIINNPDLRGFITYDD